GERIATLAYKLNQSPLIHRTSQFSASTQLKSNRGNSREAVALERDIDYYRYPDLVPLRSDWNVSLNYDLRFLTNVSEGAEGASGPVFQNEFAAHSISISGAYRPTDNWSLNYRTGIDIAERTAGFTSINATRDLHCWEMKISWVPFGSTRSYMIGINLKNQQFRQVKTQRRRTAIDF
ncbi:hypothetical protein N9W87_02140, partial [Schleiferiaceae bacterium]|nr:hypothetical protein [Schleiferiaceae bacterium]